MSRIFWNNESESENKAERKKIWLKTLPGALNIEVCTCVLFQFLVSWLLFYVVDFILVCHILPYFPFSVYACVSLVNHSCVFKPLFYPHVCPYLLCHQYPCLGLSLSCPFLVCNLDFELCISASLKVLKNFSKKYLKEYSNNQQGVKKQQFGVILQMSLYSVTVISTEVSLLSHSTSIWDDPIVNNTFSSEVPVLAE